MSKKREEIAPYEGESAIVLFHGKEVRKIFHDGLWYFSVVDAAGVLSESSNPRRYWADLKMKLLREGATQLYEEIVQLKFPSADGKFYMTDAVHTETLFRIIQSIPSKNAEPFKRWLAKVGFERLQEMADPELAIKRSIVDYKLKGYSDEWIDTRIKSITTRNELTTEWGKRGVQEGIEYAILTNTIATETFGKDVQEHKDHKHLSKRDNLRDHMTDLELILTMLGEKSTTTIAVTRDAQGFRQNKWAASDGGKIAGDARRNLETELGRSVVSSDNHLPRRKKMELADEQE